MKISIKGDLGSLLKLARDVAKAEQVGNLEELEKVKLAHDSYRDVLLKCDSISLGLQRKDL